MYLLVLVIWGGGGGGVMGVSDKGDIQNVQNRGACRTGLKTTAVA